MASSGNDGSGREGLTGGVFVTRRENFEGRTPSGFQFMKRSEASGKAASSQVGLLISRTKGRWGGMLSSSHRLFLLQNDRYGLADREGV